MGEWIGEEGVKQGRWVLEGWMGGLGRQWSWWEGGRRGGWWVE